MNSYAYVPFGLGPRNCIAMRFAREELKLVLCTLIQQFRFFPVDETPVSTFGFFCVFLSFRHLKYWARILNLA